MCGIAGAFAVSQPEALVSRMSEAIAHRGPDDSGSSVLLDRLGRARGALGHRRLAILDLSPAGHQPMRDAGGRYEIVFNGEIYNFRVLRAALERDGCQFASDGDTAVILEGWARHGRAFLPRLRGMFAFAIWDRMESSAVLVRDEFGIKPLYLARVGDGLVFASEVRAILASSAVAPRIDRVALSSYLATGSVCEPRTLIECVEALEPGCALEIDFRDARRLRCDLHRFAAGPLTPSVGLARDATTASTLVREALIDSVQHHLVSDVPVGLFLSGGIDSSAIVALAATQSAARLDTFTVTFGEREFDEAGPAAIVARRFGTRHHQVPLSATDLLTMLPAALACMDQPSMDGLNTYAVSKAVRDHGLKVVLSGLGGDEMFAGYPSSRRAAQFGWLWRPSKVIRHVLAQAAALGTPRLERIAVPLREEDPAFAAYHLSRSLFGPRIVARLGLGNSNPIPRAPAGLTPLQSVAWYELTGYMRNVLLRDSDVFSMAHGLELRVPFVDRIVAEVSCRVDDSLKLDRRISKPLIVRALGDLLPPEVWNRPKQGFVLPFERWMRNELRGDVASTLSDEHRIRRIGINPDLARGIWSGFLAHQSGFTWSRPWALFALARWAENVGAELSANVAGIGATSVWA